LAGKWPASSEAKNHTLSNFHSAKNSFVNTAR
jgi:hypothetical protein